MSSLLGELVNLFLKKKKKVWQGFPKVVRTTHLCFAHLQTPGGALSPSCFYQMFIALVTSFSLWHLLVWFECLSRFVYFSLFVLSPKACTEMEAYLYVSKTFHRSNRLSAVLQCLWKLVANLQVDLVIKVLKCM